MKVRLLNKGEAADELCKTRLNELIPFSLINSILSNLLCDFKIEYS